MFITNIFFILTCASICVYSTPLFYNCTLSKTNPFYVIFYDKSNIISWNEESSDLNFSNNPPLYVFNKSNKNSCSFIIFFSLYLLKNKGCKFLLKL